MNTRKTRLLAFAVSAALLSGCSAVPDRTSSSRESEPETSESEEIIIYEETQLKRYPAEKAEAVYKLNAEGGVFSGSFRSDGDYYDGDGYVILDEGKSLTHIAQPEYAQHYRIILGAQSYGGAVIKLSAARETVGYYYVPKSDTPEFIQLAVDCVYLPVGNTVLTFESVSGSAAVDYILIENADEVSPECYRTGTAAVAPNSSVSAIGAVKYLAEGYGKRVITAQNVTPATNAEIEAVFYETGRYPAMRCGELSILTEKDSAETLERELELGLEWGKSGGLVSYTWHWLSPDYSKSAYDSETNFSLSEALSGADIAQAAVSDYDELKALLDSGAVTAELIDIIEDIDAAAEALLRFKDEDIPVIWQPIPDGDSGLYWWSGDPQAYKALWELMFTRFCGYHSLGNVIWVWNGSSAEYRPSDKQFDILGQSICEGSSASFAGRFEALAEMPDCMVKPIALTSSDILPRYDILRRDNALWLWASAESGAVLNADGTIKSQPAERPSLFDEYNSTLCITRDELPDFSEYAVGE